MLGRGAALGLADEGFLDSRADAGVAGVDERCSVDG